MSPAFAKKKKKKKKKEMGIAFGTSSFFKVEYKDTY